MNWYRDAARFLRSRSSWDARGSKFFSGRRPNGWVMPALTGSGSEEYNEANVRSDFAAPALAIGLWPKSSPSSQAFDDQTHRLTRDPPSSRRLEAQSPWRAAWKPSEG
jgi:hypothetical protein